jgi:translation initiation factor eIF-2B subunit epsilon
MVKKGIDKHTDNLTERKEPLQAVLLADDAFTRNQFRPLNLDQPKVLCPLNNVPLIDYAIDFLASVGVEQVLVMCVADAVAEYVSQQSTRSRLTLTVIQDASFLNAGDALRELDKRSIVKSDPFLLMHADAVMNIDISAAMLAHQKRHEQDSAAIMTILMRETGVPADNLVVGMDPKQRIYYYDQSVTSIRVPCSFISTPVELRSDLVDCGIDICSPDLLARFSDNFDYGDIRREFVTNSVAEEEEGLQNIIYGHVVPEGYSSRVTDPYSYAQTSRDLLKRWCYPVVPENLFEKEFYQMQRHYLYVESNARIARSATMEGPGMIGTCTIGEHAKLTRCTVGNYCVIAADAVLKESHLWSAVEIGPGAKVTQSILADGAVIKAGAVVHPGCVIGAGCVVGENVVLPPYTRLSLKEEKEDDFGDDWDDDSSNDNEEAEDRDQPCLDTQLVGLDGKGHIWKPKPDDEEYNEDDEGYLSVAEKLKSESIGYDRAALEALRNSYQPEPSDNFSEIGDDEGMPDYLDEYSGAVTFSTDAEPFAASNNDEIIGRQKGVDVLRELKSICMEYEMISPIENLAIELNSFKFSQNASYSDCVTAATMAILERMNITKDMKDVKMATEFKKALQHWAPLLQKMSITMEEEKAIVLALERCACEETEMGTVLSSGMSFRFLLTVLEDEEVVSDKAIFAWADERKTEGDTPRGRLFRSKAVQEFLEWLREEESDDDDEEDSEEDSD